MKKLILYSAASLLLAVSFSCSDELRMDERQDSFDSQYFTYSKFHLASAIVNTAQKYGSGVKDERVGFSDLYFMDCYSSEQIGDFFTKFEQDWSFGEGGANPYTSVLRSIKAVNDIAPTEGATGNMASVAAANVLECVIYSYMTEKYGDIPYSEALDGRDGILFPKFDAQKAIYESMLAKLDEAATILADPDSKGLPATEDVLFKGDRSKWLKFANSLKFRLMVHSYEAFSKAGVDLKSQMEAIASSGIYMKEVADNASLAFNASNKDDSWYLQYASFSGSQNDFTEQKPTTYLIDQMTTLDDPRMYVIFAPVLSPWSAKESVTQEEVVVNGYTYSVTYYPVSAAKPEELISTGRDLNGTPVDVPYVLDAQWFGTPTALTLQGIYGGGSNIPGTNFPYDNRRISGFSQAINKTSASYLKAVMMESSEMYFLLAEARQKGWISSGSVQSYYENGIKQSFLRWGVVDGEKPESHLGSSSIVENFNAYCAKSGVALSGNSSDLDKIALQKWFSFALTNQYEAYTDIRRTGKPAFVVKIAPSYSSYAYPYRFRYPSNEESNNKANYMEAVSSLGGEDLPSSKMWILK